MTSPELAVRSVRRGKKDLPAKHMSKRYTPPILDGQGTELFTSTKICKKAKLPPL